jgi:transcriptional regulator with XRE-family HTH domain
METFGDRLKRLRLERGRMIKELAQKARMDPSMVSAYELGKKFPNYWNLIELAVKLDVSLDYLTGIYDESPRTAARTTVDGARRLVV